MPIAVLLTETISVTLRAFSSLLIGEIVKWESFTVSKRWNLELPHALNYTLELLEVIT